MSGVLAIAIRSTAPWWLYLMQNLGFAPGTVVSDIRGDGDFDIVDDFYAAMRGRSDAIAIEVYGAEGCSDIIRRCRVLRNLPRSRALKMIGGMHVAWSRTFDRTSPNLVISLTIDRYTTDIAARVANSRGIDYLEMTVSIIPSQVFFHRRGQLVKLRSATDCEVKAAAGLMQTPAFVPFEVADYKDFSYLKFLKVFAAFKARGAAFNVLRFLRRDPYNLHYLDSLGFLEHKPRIADISALTKMDQKWRDSLERTDPAKRVFLGLQLFPEASMDYWLRSEDMLDHDRVVLQYCDVLGASGYQIFVKDHPLQFGFRQRGLIESLAKRRHVTLVPYQVPAQPMISACAVSVTLTGTIGFQSALAGLCSVVTEPYYADDVNYVQVRKFADIEDTPKRIAQFKISSDATKRGVALVRKLADASVPGDYFTFRKFEISDDAKREAMAPLGGSLSTYLPDFMATAAA